MDLYYVQAGIFDGISLAYSQDERCALTGKRIPAGQSMLLGLTTDERMVAIS